MSSNSPKLSEESELEEHFSAVNERSSFGGGVFEEIDDDVDAPRVARWVDEEDLDTNEEDNDEDEDDPNNESKDIDAPLKLKSLQNDLSSLPLGALRKAQRALTQAKVDRDSVDGGLSADDDSDSDEEVDAPILKGKEKPNPEWNTKRRTDLAKRSSKHAPTEITSKRPITRRRTVVEVKTVQPRDPRFLPLAGEFSGQKFKERYSFLVDVHINELKTLKENLKRARKLLLSSPHDLRLEREQEVNRLEMAVKRAESKVNQDTREMAEQEALSKISKEEREKRKQGKHRWWMKDSDKRDILVRARYEALAARGQRVMKKAMEKKQKKISQKEKKLRPFARGQAGGNGKRPSSSSNSREEGGFDKRRRLGI